MNDSQLLSTLTVGEFKALLRHMPAKDSGAHAADLNKQGYLNAKAEFQAAGQPVKHVWPEFKFAHRRNDSTCECILCRPL